MNIVYLLGNLGQDVTTRRTQRGSLVANASIATNKNEKVNGEWKQKSTWHRVTAFGKTAERLAQLRKGEMVFLVGELAVESWQAQDGTQKQETKVYASKVLRAQELRLDEQPDNHGNSEAYSTPPF